MPFIFLSFSLLQKQGEVKPLVQRQMLILANGTEVAQRLSWGSQSGWVLDLRLLFSALNQKQFKEF